MILKRVIKFFDKTEDKIRLKLSHYPVLYAFIGGIGVVLFWRGVWHLADDINIASSVSLVIGAIVLLMTGVFVSEFIGKKLIISDLGGEKKLTEKEESEIKTESTKIQNLQNTLDNLERKLDHLETHLETDAEKEIH